MEAQTKSTLLDLVNQISKGELPTQEALISSLSHAKQLLSEQGSESAKLDSAAKKIADDLRQFIAAAEALAQKNKDHNLEKLIEHGKTAALEIQKQVEEMSKKFGKAANAIEVHWTRSFEDIREAVLQIVASAEFRDLAAGLVRALYNIATGPLAEKGKEWAKIVSEVTPMEIELPSAPAPASAKGKGKGRKRKTSEETDKVLETLANYTPLSASDLKTARDQLVFVLERLSSSGAYRQASKAAFRVLEDVWALTREMRRELQPVAETAAKRGKKAAGKAKEGASKAAQEVKEGAEKASKELSEAMHVLAENENLKLMWADAKAIVEKFTGGRKIDSLIDDFGSLFDVLSQNAELGNAFMEFVRFLRDSIAEPARLKESTHLERLSVLLEGARAALYQLKAIPLLAKILWDVLDVINSVKSDPALAGLAEASRNLLSDLFQSTAGGLSMKPEVVTNMRNVIVSLLVQELKHITVPTIEGSTDTYDYKIENISLSGYDLLPQHIDVRVESDTSVEVGNMATNTKAHIYIKATKIKTHMENVKFWFRRRGVLVDIQDEGIAAVGLKGDGASVLVHVKTQANRLPGDPLFKVKSVEVDLDQLHIHIMESKYDWLLNLLSPLLSSNIKSMFEREVAGAVMRATSAMERELSCLVENAPSAEKMAAALKERLGSVGDAASAAASSIASTIMS